MVASPEESAADPRLRWGSLEGWLELSMIYTSDKERTLASPIQTGTVSIIIRNLGLPPLHVIVWVITRYRLEPLHVIVLVLNVIIQVLESDTSE